MLILIIQRVVIIVVVVMAVEVAVVVMVIAEVLAVVTVVAIVAAAVALVDVAVAVKWIRRRTGTYLLINETKQSNENNIISSRQLNHSIVRHC